MNRDIIRVRIAKEADIARVRQVTDCIGASFGLESFARTRCITACLEIARNALQYAGGGQAFYRLTFERGHSYLFVSFIDQGTGIDKIEKILEGRAFLGEGAGGLGGRGLGLGLRGVKRLAHRFDLTTSSEGTTVELGFEVPIALSEQAASLAKAADHLAALSKTDPLVELSRQNRELAEALAERELLMAEVHHRTGNNLALVKSIIQMSRRKAQSEEAKHLLAELESRIHSIVRVHQDLQKTLDTDEIDALPFLRSVGANSADAFSHVEKNIVVTVTGDDLVLPSKLMVDLGLIVSELITNAIKHAFPQRSEGNITIALSRLEADEPGAVLLCVSDDGVGLADGERPERSDSLGWRMIRAVATRHQGTLDVDGSDGMTVKLELRH